MVLLLNKKIPILLSLVLSILIIGVEFGLWTGAEPYLQRLEHLLYDLRLQLFPIQPPQITHPKIVIVSIDEKSLKQEGRWPWPRKKLSDLVDRLSLLSPALITFDMVFAERDPLHDPSFIQSLQTSKSVIAGFILHEGDVDDVGTLPTPIFAQEIEGKDLPISNLSGFISNLPAIESALLGSGFLTIFPDHDGIIRRAPLVLRHRDHLYPSLALEVARRYLLEESIQIRIAKQGEREVVEALHLGKLRTPTDKRGAVLIPYTSDHSFLQLSATDVLQNTVDPQTLQNAIVFIGASALGIGDLQPTPIALGLPGVEIQASLLSGLLNQTIPYEPDWTAGFHLSVLVGIGIAFSFFLPYLSAVSTLLGVMGILGVLIVGNFGFWQKYLIALPLALPFILISILTLFHLAYGYLGEGRYRRRLKQLFGQYVPPEIIKEMIMHPKISSGFEGESREMTVLFADIKHFTTIAENSPASQTKQLLQHFLTPMTEIIFKHRGTVDKYVGDMIMAFWGAPIPDLAHADHACAAALEMLDVLENKLNPEWKKKNLPNLNIGIGISTGLMNVGDMGSKFRRSYTVIGDAVNCGSRFEQLTRYYEVPLIVGEATAKKQTQFICQKLDRVSVRGREDDPISIYQPLCLKEKLTEAMAEDIILHESAVNFYLSGERDKAKIAFEQLKQKTALPLYQVFLNRM
ncbi:MAG: adenylate/guanylate cyclase domain-containing protein [Gammaproteobacteria bacterium]|nr:adenylate/guanylate cyclase domain-containing protein [Gammaproteobacteria bacterium]